jgi:hypothetical protein
MICINSVVGRALLMGGVAAGLTAMSTGEDWLTKDYMFVLAVVAVVLIGGLRKAKYERLMQHERLQRGTANLHSLSGSSARSLRKLTATRNFLFVLLDQLTISTTSTTFEAIQCSWS